MSESDRIGRVAMLSVHTSPLDPPGTGDAGGLNVYVVETARRLAARGTEVEIFTRATDGSLPETVRMGPGILVHHVMAGPYEGLAKDDLPGQLCAFAAGVMRTAAGRPEHAGRSPMPDSTARMSRDVRPPRVGSARNVR